MADFIARSTAGEAVPITGNRKKWAQVIYNAAQKLPLSAALKKRACVAGFMTALVESKLLMYANRRVPSSLDYPHDAVGSDHNSLGLMQQRPPYWGSVKELMNGDYNARAFFGGSGGPNNGSPPGLLDKSGWETGDLGSWCQSVQVSAFPDRYRTWEKAATLLYESLSDTPIDPGIDPEEDDDMAKPVSVEPLGNGLLIRMDNGSRVTALETASDLWLVSQVTEPPVNPDPPKPPSGNRFVWPFPLDQVTSEYGPRWGRLHAGIDFGRGSSNSGGSIKASSAGRVVISKNNHGGYGSAVVLDHGGGLHTLYGHMAPGTRAVRVGQSVTQGQHLGNTGNTGASRGVHLHFETHEGGYRWNASSRNPRLFFKKWNK